MEKHKAVAKVLGNGYAYIQHGTDKVIEWGFAKMKESEHRKKDSKEFKNKYARVAATAAKGTLGFLGVLGQSYYDKYRELKNTESVKEKKKSN